ncbi:hypothetical protein L195_g014803 [Trifolium pratense]|uniref:Uncharacterized protein n=1 Tax=Trifolium pratense TaxID=57577 RepID=A0A2K3N1P8_TRIPR|nr:hypothetical protein L195_g029311 [Trifolium pratense]PNX96957.1 hypothetical protein L195_g020175 [Trifolium pratense]PNY18046.1 hypothetical protein L195_g014803 [Trifolium pratense]
MDVLGVPSHYPNACGVGHNQLCVLRASDDPGLQIVLLATTLEEEEEDDENEVAVPEVVVVDPEGEMHDDDHEPEFEPEPETGCQHRFHEMVVFLSLSRSQVGIV